VLLHAQSSLNLKDAPATSANTHSSLEPTTSIISSSNNNLHGSEPPDNIVHNLQRLQIDVLNWQYDWGPENLWDLEFNSQLSIVWDDGQDAVDIFFRNCETHTIEGREILRDLNFVASVSCHGTLRWGTYLFRDLRWQSQCLAVKRLLPLGFPVQTNTDGLS
jgi:hypothetical protein